MQECDVKCEVELRNQRFREALQISTERDVIPYPSQLLDKVVEDKLGDFVLKMENNFTAFLEVIFCYFLALFLSCVCLYVCVCSYAFRLCLLLQAPYDSEKTKYLQAMAGQSIVKTRKCSTLHFVSV